MYRETVEFFTHLIREDRPVRDIILADYTFLNERLAKFYGIPGVTGDDFRQVAVAAYHRGGVLGMASLLAETASPQRTSPVLRGNWLLASCSARRRRRRRTMCPSSTTAVRKRQPCANGSKRIAPTKPAPLPRQNRSARLRARGLSIPSAACARRMRPA